MVDVSIVTPLYSLEYARFLPAWWESIEQLDPAPADVVIAHTEIVTDIVSDYPVRTVLVDEPSCALDAGLRISGTKWLAMMCMDDTYVADAFASVEGATTDIVGFNLQGTSGTPLRNSWDSLSASSNGVNYHSVFTRELFNSIGGVPAVFYHDWAFWLKAKTIGATFYDAPGIQVIYDDTTVGRMSHKAPADAAAQVSLFINTEEHHGNR